MSDDCAVYSGSSSDDDELSEPRDNDNDCDWEDTIADDHGDIIDGTLFKKLPLPSAPPAVLPTHGKHPPPLVQNFEYSPLNYQAPSIRVLRLRSEKSKDGLIQCDIRNAMISDNYSCLSYVWGDETDGGWIILNDRKFWVRRNLLDFLTYARPKPQLRERWLWVDALCIDQTTLLERNHQVQQMGEIYSSAVTVISWLGCDNDVAGFLKDASTQKQEEHRVSKGFGAFCSLEYWDRAWITQEIVLARRVRFMSMNHSLDGTLIPFDNEHYCQLRIANLHPKTASSLRGRSLIYLIDKFRQKEAGNRRDRVFSLLALCGDGSSLEVDYNIALPALARNVLRACKQSFCLCSIGIVGTVLGLPSDLEGEDRNLAKLAFAKIKIPDQPLISGMTLYYRRPCHITGCVGTDSWHELDRARRPTNRTKFAVTLDLQYFCTIWPYGQDHITFFVDANLKVIDFERSALHPSHVRDSHRVGADFGGKLCTIRISFDLLHQIARLPPFTDRCCTRVASQGTATVVDTSALLEFSVLDTSAEDY